MISNDIFIIIAGIFVILSEVSAILVIRNNEKYFEMKYEELRKWYYTELEKARAMYNVSNVVNEDVKQSKIQKKLRNIK